jgi:acetylornithine deacetylase/succinyl-diaminopimelate desuccinylase-like protein
MIDRIAALDQYVELHVQESMQELARLCNQPSISSQGLGMRECATLVADLLRSRGIAAQVMGTGGYPVVFGEYGTGERTLLLYNHYDVQPPEPLDQWDSPPFAAVQRDGKLFARGAEDDKGELISRLACTGYLGYPFEKRALLVMLSVHFPCDSNIRQMGRRSPT